MPGHATRNNYYIGIDIGSGSVKTALLDAGNHSIRTASREYATFYPQQGHVEQNPDDWYSAVCESLRELLSITGVSRDSIGGVGLSGTSHVPTMLDNKGLAVRPSILWNDRRSDDQVRKLSEQYGADISKATLNTISCTWSLPQIAWVRENEPDTFRRVKHVLFSKDYIGYRLTSCRAADATSAYSSLFVDQSSLAWNTSLLEMAGLARDNVSDISPSMEIIGATTSEAAIDTGLRTGTPVIAGMIDSAAELIGVGAIDPSVAVIRLGTAGGVMTLTDKPQLLHGCLLYPHPVKPFWYHQAGTNAATTSLQWVKLLFSTPEAPITYEEIDREIRQVSPGADGVIFHPYLLGERAPLWNSEIRGGFSGLSMNHRRDTLLRAVQEGVAYSLKDCLQLVDLENVRMIRVCGGGAKSTTWSQIISDVINLPVERMLLPDASAFGAALAAFASIEGVGIDTLCQEFNYIQEVIQPQERNREIYDINFYKFKSIADTYVRLC